MSRPRRQSLRDNMHNLGRRISQATDRLGRRLSDFAHLNQGRFDAVQGGEEVEEEEVEEEEVEEEEEEDDEAAPALPDLPAPMAEIELFDMDQSSLKLDDGNQSREKENTQVDAPSSGTSSSAKEFGTGSQTQSSDTEPYRSPKSSSNSSSRLLPPSDLPSDPPSGKRSTSEHDFEKNLQHKPEASKAAFVQRARARLEREAQAREEYTATTEQIKYGKLQQAGLLRLRWIEDPNRSDCPIAKSTLTFDAFHQMMPSGNVRAENIALGLEDHIVGLRLPNEFYDYVEESAYRAFDYTSVSGEMQWVGRTGPGVIFLEVLERQEGFPHISDITLAFYKRDFPIDRLKYIFVCTVIQPETFSFVRHRLYPANSIPWPSEKSQAWALGTPEYEALLGTRIGKMVAYIVCGGFDRGTRQIEQILTWSTAQGFVNLRFDIKPSERSILLR